MEKKRVFQANGVSFVSVTEPIIVNCGLLEREKSDKPVEDCLVARVVRVSDLEDYNKGYWVADFRVTWKINDKYLGNEGSRRRTYNYRCADWKNICDWKRPATLAMI